MAKRDDEVLRDVSAEVYRAMSRVGRISGLSLHKPSTHVAEETCTGGWRVTLGKLTGRPWELQIWLDRYTNHAERMLWYGLSSGEKKLMTEPRRRGWRVARTFYSSDVANDDADNERLEKKLPPSMLRKPILEAYGHCDEYFFGMYDDNPRTLRRSDAALEVERIAAFLAPLAGPMRTALGRKGTSDVAVRINEGSRNMVRAHNKMTNALRRLCEAAGLSAYEGRDVGAFYDVLIARYAGKRDLLIEAKSDRGRASIRLAVGQLLDYRRSLPRASDTDPAVLLTRKPTKDDLSYLKAVGIKTIWFEGNLKRLRGDWELA